MVAGGTFKAYTYPKQCAALGQSGGNLGKVGDVVLCWEVLRRSRRFYNEPYHHIIVHRRVAGSDCSKGIARRRPSIEPFAAHSQQPLTRDYGQCWTEPARGSP